MGYKLCAVCCALNQICRERKTKVKQTLDSCWCVCTCSYLIYKTSFHLCLHLLGLFWVNGVELYNMFLLSMFLHHALLACSILYPLSRDTDCWHALRYSRSRDKESNSFPAWSRQFGLLPLLLLLNILLISPNDSHVC